MNYIRWIFSIFQQYSNKKVFSYSMREASISEGKWCTPLQESSRNLSNKCPQALNLFYRLFHLRNKIEKMFPIFLCNLFSYFFRWGYKYLRDSNERRRRFLFGKLIHFLKQTELLFITTYVRFLIKMLLSHEYD